MQYALVAASLFAAAFAAPGWGPPGQYGDHGSWGEGASTVEVTVTETVTSCAKTIQDCSEAAPATSAPAYSAPAYSAPAGTTPPVYSAPPAGSTAAPVPSGYPSGGAGGWGSSAAPSYPAGSSAAPVPSYPVSR